MRDAAMYGCIVGSQGRLQGKQPCTAASLAAKDGCKASNQGRLNGSSQGWLNRSSQIWLLEVKMAGNQGWLNGSSQIWLLEGKDGMAALYGCLKAKTAVSRAEHGSASYIVPNTT